MLEWKLQLGSSFSCKTCCLCLCYNYGRHLYPSLHNLMRKEKLKQEDVEFILNAEASSSGIITMIK